MNFDIGFNVDLLNGLRFDFTVDLLNALRFSPSARHWLHRLHR